MTTRTIRRNGKGRRRPGIIFVTTIWVIVVLAALVLLFAREIRVEAAASANRVAAEQASSLEQAGEQYVLSAVDACNGDAVTVLQTPAEMIQVGDPTVMDQTNHTMGGSGYFWILQYYPDDDTTPAFGITDESSKLNLNIAAGTDLALLPNMTQDVADSIVLWHGGAATGTSGQGTSDYSSTGRPYTLKAAPFESVEELYLIKNVTDTLLYGYDLDRNGMLDNNEQNAGGMATAYNSASGSGRGIFPFVTVWGSEPNTDSNGKPRINISQLTDPTALRALLTKELPASRVQQILIRAMQTRQFKSIFDFASKTQMKSAELELVADSLTTSSAKTLPGLININTAPQAVLMCLPGLTQQDAESIITARASRAGDGTSGLGSATSAVAGEETDYSWVMDAVTPAKAAAIGSRITGRSFFYSADIVAVTSDGRSFKRARIVVDASKSPPVIVYRKDLSHLGWPLDPAIMTALKTNKPLPGASGFGTGGANGLSQPF